MLPQLRLIQNMMVRVKQQTEVFVFYYNPLFLYSNEHCGVVQFVEPITAHYVFALGIARLFNCTQWALQVWFHMNALLIY